MTSALTKAERQARRERRLLAMDPKKMSFKQLWATVALLKRMHAEKDQTEWQLRETNLALHKSVDAAIAKKANELGERRLELLSRFMNAQGQAIDAVGRAIAAASTGNGGPY